jgi:hypothetical membrane protein
MLAIALFVLVVIVAHVVATHQYDWMKNTISDLGAQGYQRKLIMQTGFILFGAMMVAGVVLNGLSWRTAPILIYAVCVGLTGVFCTKPFFQATGYSVAQATAHSVLAQIAGIAFTTSIVVQFFLATTNNQRFIHLFFLVMVVAFSMLFALLPAVQGVSQRLLYLVSFVWLIRFFRP